MLALKNNQTKLKSSVIFGWAQKMWECWCLKKLCGEEKSDLIGGLYVFLAFPPFMFLLLESASKYDFKQIFTILANISGDLQHFTKLLALNLSILVE